MIFNINCNLRQLAVLLNGIWKANTVMLVFFPYITEQNIIWSLQTLEVTI